MIAGDADAIGAADQRDAGGGVAIVADDVAEADDAVDRSLGDVVKRRLQGLEIGVDVGNEREPHRSLHLHAPGCSSFCPPMPGSRRCNVERTTGIGSLHDSADFALQLTIQGNHVVSGTPAARAAGRSFQARHHRTPAFAGVVAGRGVPVKSAYTNAGMLTPAT